MKRPAFIVSIIPLIFISCSSPQLTVMPETTRMPEVVFSATPSNTPEPPTPTPEPTLSPEQQAQAELNQFHLTLGEDYTFSTDADGKILATDKAGTVIYKDGSYNANEIVGIVEQANICKGTPYEPNPDSKSANRSPKDLSDFMNFYFIPNAEKIALTPEFGKVNSEPLSNLDENGKKQYNYGFRSYVLGGEKNCWLVFIYPKNPSGPINFAIFETESGWQGLRVFQP